MTTGLFSSYRVINEHDPIGEDEVVVQIMPSSEVVYLQKGTYGQSYSEQSVRPVSKLLVAKTPDKTLVELKNQVDKMSSEKYAAEWAANELKTENEKLKKKLQDANQEVTDIHDAFKTCKKTELDLRSMNRALEADLGKIRNHFGEKAIKEALDGR